MVFYSSVMDKIVQFQIHWFSIFNSFMMVVFLIGLVAMILVRTLHKDYARYSKDEEMDDMERDLGDEYGWKQVNPRAKHALNPEPGNQQLMQ